MKKLKSLPGRDLSTLLSKTLEFSSKPSLDLLMLSAESFSQNEWSLLIWKLSMSTICFPNLNTSASMETHLLSISWAPSYWEKIYFNFRNEKCEGRTRKMNLATIDSNLHTTSSKISVVFNFLSGSLLEGEVKGEPFFSFGWMASMELYKSDLSSCCSNSSYISHTNQ